MERTAVGRGTRVFVRGFLAVFLLCGLLSIEVWPFTGFNLYARRHHRTREGWQVVALDAAHVEQRISFEALPIAYRKTTKLLDDDTAHARRVEVCASLAAA